MIEVAAAAAISMLAASASPTPDLPSYEPAAVAISREARVHTAARLEEDGSCLVMRTFGQVEGVIASPIWPNGTRREGDVVRLPDGAPVPVGKRIGLMGRFVEPTETALASLTGGCSGKPLLIERANQLFAWRNPAELVETSDAVLVVRVDGIDTNDPLGDGMLTTIDVTVADRLAGPKSFRDRKLKLRVASGMDAQGRWQTSSHDPLYGPFGGLKHELVGERLLLFVNQDLYSEQARVRGGQILPGLTGGSLFFRLEGDRIVNDGDLEMPASLGDLRKEMRRS